MEMEMEMEMDLFYVGNHSLSRGATIEANLWMDAIFQRSRNCATS
jgi:hypothetical protein